MKKTAVIVGRFQAHKLTEGHKNLIREVITKCEQLIIFVGVYPLKADFKNPLPYEIREWMLYEFLPPYVLVSHNVKIAPIVDVFNIPLWSNNLDQQIKFLVNSYNETELLENVTMYGSRDSFIFNYKGMFKTHEVKANGDDSASKLREEIKNMDIHNVDESFRKGIIWSLRNK